MESPYQTYDTMKRPFLYRTLIAITGCISLTAGVAMAQGIRNEGATIVISPGTTLSCTGQLTNNTGIITNNGTVSLSGSLDNSASLEGDGICYVGGDWTNSGSFDPGSGMVVFNGSGPQLITAPYLTVFHDLVISESGEGTTITPGAMVTVEGSLFEPNGRLAISSAGPDSSGSLIYLGEGTPAGNLTYRRSMPAGTYYSYVSSPVSAETLPADATFWAWNEPAGDWGDPVTACTGGTGYTVSTGGQPLSFTGPLVTAIDLVATSPYINDYSTGTPEEYDARIGRDPYGGGGCNLLGNPFTSAMRVGGTGGFLDDNDGDGSIPTNSFDPNYVAVYIYDGDSYYYRGKDVNFPDPYQGEDPANEMFGFDNVQAGQGFFVLAMKNGVVFHFDREMQTHATNTLMLKSTDAEQVWPGIRLTAMCDGKESHTYVVLGEEMTAGLDPGYDVGLLSSGANAEIYTTLVASDNNVNFARQALPVTWNDEIVIPVGVDSKNGGLVTFGAFALPPGDKRFWLEDRERSIFTDIGTTGYQVTLPANSYGTGRFYLHASANMPSAVDDDIRQENNGLRVWTYDRMIIIKGPVGDNSLCELYDTAGRKLLSCRLNDRELNTVALPSGVHGVLVVRVIDGHEVMTVKVVAP
jgi:adhesin HecA-like repeat protein